ncbi:MAG TPA: DUF177 domain-containing protein [Flavobacteriia bacterium]|nr:DUF177 domain-containing protein [Flavobacteriia bacterium]
MRSDYLVSFKGLKEGEHHFDYEIDKKFFESFTYDDYLDSQIHVDLKFVKKPTLMELFFNVDGSVLVNCDVSGEEFNQPIKGSLEIIVKFGDDFNNDDDVVLILPHESHSIDVAQYIYETIILSTPVKRIHPGVKDGTLKSEVIDKLKELENNKLEEKKIDPRWDKLKGLI